MKKKLIVTAKKIHCVDPQDPFMDELYFITAADNKSHTTKTIRKLKKGTTKQPKLTLLSTTIDDASVTPIEITVWEQRALRDNGKLAKALEKVAGQGKELAKEHLDGLSWPQVVVQVAAWLLENATSIFKHIFADSPLGTKELVIPRKAKGAADKQDFPKSIDGTYSYDWVVKGRTESYYRYELELEVVIG